MLPIRRPVLNPLVSRLHCGKTTSSSTPSIPKIAILDDYLNIATDHFAHLPQSKISLNVFTDSLPPYTHSSTTTTQREALITRLKPFTVLSAMRERTPFPADLLRSLPNLQLILATGTQFETFDLAAARECGIAVTAAPGRGRTDSTSATPRHPNIKAGASHPTTQHTWALILALARNVASDDAAMKDPARRAWQTSLARGLYGKMLGVVGLGRLGGAAARIAVLAFGMRVLCWSENLTQEKADRKAVELGLLLRDDSGAPTFLAVQKRDLFCESDVVSLHYVLGERSRHLVSGPELGCMKEEALLVNTSRGGLIDDEALYGALMEGRIGGAALDVFDLEPLPRESDWRSTEWGKEGRSNLLLTPHMGYVEEALMHTWYEETAENLERWLEGKELLHRLA